MLSPDAIRTILGIVGNAISLFLFLSPVPTFIQICKKGSVEQYSPVPYLATLINCMVWTLYGLPIIHPGSMLVVTVNGTGIVIELVYIILFLIYSDGKKKRLKVLMIMLVMVIFVALLALLVLIFAHSFSRRSAIVGTVCVLFSIMMYASPLTVMKLVINTKSVEYMPFSLSFASLANGVVWTAYAFIPFDPFITVPNGIGTLSALVQLLLYATFYKSTQRIIAERKGQIRLSEVVVNDGSPPEKTTVGRDFTASTTTHKT